MILFNHPGSLQKKNSRGNRVQVDFSKPKCPFNITELNAGLNFPLALSEDPTLYKFKVRCPLDSKSQVAVDLSIFDSNTK